MYRIMLVDNDVPNLNAMREILGDRDFGSIEAFSDVGQAARRAAECVFDVVIAECRACGVGDMEFARQFRRLQQRAAMILVASRYDSGFLFEAVNSVGVLRVFGKPWDGDALCEAVAQALIQREYSARLERMQDLVMDQQRVIERQADILLRLEMAHPGITSAS
jgi:DNA-binding NtrC family response regulator